MRKRHPLRTLKGKIHPTHDRKQILMRHNANFDICVALADWLPTTDLLGGQSQLLRTAVWPRRRLKHAQVLQQLRKQRDFLLRGILANSDNADHN